MDYLKSIEPLKYEQFLEKVVDSLDIGIAAIDNEGRQTLANKKFCEITGFRREDLIGSKAPFKYWADEGINDIKFAFEQTLQGVDKDWELLFQKKNGERFLALISPVKLTNPVGHISYIATVQDITAVKKKEEERKRMEEQIRQSEERYRTLVENLSDYIYMLDERCRVLSVNLAAANVLQRRPEEIVGKSIFDLFPKDFASQYSASVKEVFESGQGASKESKMVVGENEMWISTSLNPVKGPLGRTISVIGASRDITEHKHLEVKLQESEKRYHSLFANMMDGFAYCKLLLDNQGRPVDFVYLDVNRAFGRLTGLENVVGKKVTEVIPTIKALNPELFEIYGRVALTGQPEAFEIDFKPLQKWFSVAVYSPEREHFIAVFDDITERKYADEALRESEAKYRALVENSPNFVMIYQEGIKYVNNAMCERLGWTFDEMTSSSFNAIDTIVSKAYQDLAKENLEKRMRREKVSPYETVLRTKSGIEIPAIVHATAIPYRGAPAIEYIFVDITERKQAEADRIKVMSEVAMSIAHDLRNPLQAIQAATYAIEKAPETERRKILDLIDRNLKYSDGIVRNLRDFASLSPPKLNESDVNTLLQETLSQIDMPKNVEVSTDYGKIPIIMLDANEVNRALTNLTLNAVQSMREGGELNVSTSLDGSFIRIRIQDNGAGISKENIEKIFTPFFTTKAKGTGLGLYTAKKIIETHKGIITVESESGKGTTVTVLLPITIPRKDGE